MGHDFTIRACAAALVVAAACGAGLLGAEQILPPSGIVSDGVRLDGELVAGRAAGEVVAARADALLRRRVVVRHGDVRLIDTSLAELGASIDRAPIERALAAIGHEGGFIARIDDAREARRGRRALSLDIHVPVEPLAALLAAHKDGFDHPPEPARWDFAQERASAHRDGETLDVYATADRIADAARRGDVDIEVAVLRQAPRATREAVAAIDRSTSLSAFETRFAFTGGQAGRAQNIARAAAGVDGLVMMPGDVISFNDMVGPRSLDNGFAEAGEIYKGEMRTGVGGGTCQVASTFHAAAYLGGMAVVERSPHSRPSGYIGIGLDATVAYPHVDLKLSNPFAFPVTIRALVIDSGTLRVEVLGERRLATVGFAAETVGVKPYKRTIRDATWLASGEVKQKQAGRRGVTVEKTRTIRYVDGTERVETTRDVYPPTNEVYYVNPADDPAALLPPLVEDASG